MRLFVLFMIGLLLIDMGLFNTMGEILAVFIVPQNLADLTVNSGG